MAAPIVTFLERCMAPRLIRMSIEGVARFVLLGRQANAFIPAYVLFEDRCELFNLSGEVGLLSQYDGAAVLDFGSDFTIRPSYSAFCEIDKGDLFRTAGAIVRTEDADFLVATANWRRDPVYCNIKTGDHKGEPGGARVAFAYWTMFTADDEKSPIVQVNVQNSS